MVRKLEHILEGTVVVDILNKSKNENVDHICFDSRKAEKNGLFVAIKGLMCDGHQFIPDVIEKGARFIVCEDLPSAIYPEITYVKVKDSHAALGWIASNFYGRPSSKLKLVGVTGTNGKTSIVTLLYNLFTNLGYHCGLFSTIRNLVAGEETGATHTTPDPVQLNALMAEMVKKGCGYCFMEVSSHAAHQKRIAGLVFAGGIFTNLTRDHLDYHGSFKAYIDAKKDFFDMLPETAFALVNIDDKNGPVMLQNTKAKKQGYALKTLTDFKGNIVEKTIQGMQVRFNNKELWLRLTGIYNAYNMLAVYGTAVLLEQDDEQVLPLLSNLIPVRGRFELVYGRGQKTGIVDYAHTPDALQNVLDTILELRAENQQIVTVVGAGGDRDKGKRPLMAEIAANASDKVVITSDNPRFEDPEAIINDMMVGIPLGLENKVLQIANRKEAIKTACLLAPENSIILVAGKGHEDYQDVKGVKHHFDDKEILQELLNR
jgi:UDP-N-acetylmuramoyl-L-alanyl-D-glutamate--2,6-diaminopimelate ligase